MNIMELRQSLDCLFLIYQMVYCILKMTYIKDKYMMIDKKIIVGVEIRMRMRKRAYFIDAKSFDTNDLQAIYWFRRKRNQ